MRFPVRAPFRLRQVSDDFILHDPLTNAVHRLNSVAAVVWQLCDGTRDRTSIASQVALMFGRSPAEVTFDVDEILKRFMDEGLVYSSAGPQEAEVLLYCVRTALGTGSLDQTTGQDWTDLDWRYIEQTALQHGVLPLVYRGLRDVGATVPVRVLQQLERHVSTIAERNRGVLQELLELLEAFDAHDIRALPVKGPTLAVQLYGDVGLRQFSDLDIFIPPDCVERAQDLLIRRGCQLETPTRVNVEAEYRGRHGRVTIDLQWAFAPKLRFPVDFAKLWATVERVDLGPARVLQPTPTDQLRMITAHAAKHCWSRLVWLSDVTAFFARHQHTLDWCEALDAARDSGGSRIVGVSAGLAAALLSARVPAAIAASMEADRRVAQLEADVRPRVLAPPVKNTPNVRGSYGVWEGGRLYISSRERLRDKLPFFWYLLGFPVRRLRSIATPNVHDRSAIALPRPVAFLYYLVRPIRLTIQYWATVKSRVRG
jgi:hypothetical protein